jgi:RHS repeat-associated protein
LLSETLPSGRVIAAGYDGANRPAYLQGNFGTSTTPYIGNKTNPIQYWPHGVPYKVPLGNGLWHTLWPVNGHLQPTAYWDAVNDNGNDFLRIEYPNWVNGSGQNNGNLQGTTIWAGGPSPSANLPQFSESFTYDGENRLTSASDSGGWSRGFSYDQWGNMAVTANNGVPAMNVNTPQSLSLFNANNQRTDQTYFPNGNLKSIQPGITLAYDAENRQTSAGGYSYSYDGAGHRVAKIGGGATTIYVYDAAGQLAEEYAPGSAWKKDYVRLGSQLIAEEYNGTVSASMPCTTCYFTYDHLGTVRLITDQNANVISRHDYLPFGEEIPANTAGRNGQFGPANDSVTQKFTGKERDAESGLDYFGARYYGSALGRFTSPDWSADVSPVPYAKLDNPQTLNLYAYVGNNPLARTDQDGHACSSLLGNTGSGFCQRAAEYANIDANSKVRSQTRFFAAASAVSQALADVATPVSGTAVSKKTAGFLEGVGKNLEKVNQKEAAAIQSGSLGGPNLDSRMVHTEQTEVQSQLDNLQKSDPSGYKQTISEINGALNPTGVEAVAGKLFPTDRAYGQVLDGVRGHLGGNIDFSRQGDREAIGNALINHIRQPGGNDVTGAQ